MDIKLHHENTELKHLLRLALDEMVPQCHYCTHRDNKPGVCVSECTWRYERAARDIIDGKTESREETK